MTSTILFTAGAKGGSGKSTAARFVPRAGASTSVLTGNMRDVVMALESGRERLLQARQPQQVVGESIDGEVAHLK